MGIAIPSFYYFPSRSTSTASGTFPATIHSPVRTSCPSYVRDSNTPNLDHISPPVINKYIGNGDLGRALLFLPVIGAHSFMAKFFISFYFVSVKTLR